MKRNERVIVFIVTCMAAMVVWPRVFGPLVQPDVLVAIPAWILLFGLRDQIRRSIQVNRGVRVLDLALTIIVVVSIAAAFASWRPEWIGDSHLNLLAFVPCAYLLMVAVYHVIGIAIRKSRRDAGNGLRA